MLVQGAVTACARVSMRFDSSVVQNPTKWRNNGLMRPRRRDFTLPLVRHGGDCLYIYRPTHSAALNSSGGRRVVHVPGTRPDEFFSPLFPLFGLFNSGKRSRSRRRGPSYRVWWWWGPASGRWLPISSARWTSSQQFLFSPSYSTVLFISLCPVGGSSTIRRRLLRSHRILNHTVFIERQVLIENLFLCVCVLSEKEREPFTFSNCICINIKHSVTLHRRNITRGEKDGLGRNKTIGDLLISLFIQSVSFIGVLGLPRKRENRSPRVNSL